MFHVSLLFFVKRRAPFHNLAIRALSKALFLPLGGLGAGKKEKRGISLGKTPPLLLRRTGYGDKVYLLLACLLSHGHTELAYGKKRA